MSTETSATLTAPDGTYEQLAAIENGRLGNAYTKRWVAVTPDQDVLQIVVRIDEQRELGHHWERSTRFYITPDNTVTGLEAFHYQLVYNGERKPIEPPPPLETVLQEIRVAQRKQPKLKPRR